MSTPAPQPTGWAANVIAVIEWMRANPVIPLDIVKAALAVGVVLGWWAAPGEPVTDLASAAAAIAFGVLTVVTHRSTQAAP